MILAVNSGQFQVNTDNILYIDDDPGPGKRASS